MRRGRALLRELVAADTLACSSMAELTAVNRPVASSSLATPVGAFAPSSRSALELIIQKG